MSLEFEHFMGTNSIPQGALFHPNDQKYVFAAGACVVIGDLLDPHSQNFLRYHDDYISCIAVSRSGRYIASGQLGEAADVVVYDTEAQQVLYRCEEHDHGIQTLAFSEDERLLATIGVAEDSNMILWDLSNGCIIASTNKIAHDTKCASFVGFVKDIKRRDTDHYQICTAGGDGLTLWDLDPYSGDLLASKVTGDPRGTISRHITHLHYTSDFEYIYASTSSGDFVICNVKSLRIVSSVVATKMSLNSILLHNGSVYIGCSDKTIKIYTYHGDFVKAIEMDGAVLSLSLSPDQLELLALTGFGSICRVNIATSQSIVLSESHTGAILKVAFDIGNPDRIASISADHTIKVWDLSDYAVISTAYSRREQEPGATPLSLVFHNLLFSGWSDGKILAHSAETGESLWLLDNAHPGGVSALVLSHNKRFLLSGAPSGDVRLWELRTRELISHLKEHKQKISSLRLLEDDTVAFTASRDRCILTWDLRNERRVHCHMQRMGGINDFVLSKDQSHVISVGQDKRMAVWNVRQNDIIYSTMIDGENDEAVAIDISSDGEFVVTGGTAGMLRLWRLYLPPHSSQPALQKVHEVLAHSKAISSLQISGTDKQVVSAGLDGSIFCWWLNK